MLDSYSGKVCVRHKVGVDQNHFDVNHEKFIAALLQQEVARWAKIIKTAKIQEK